MSPEIFILSMGCRDWSLIRTNPKAETDKPVLFCFHLGYRKERDWLPKTAT
jgi:hypothetical protein